MKNHFIVIEGVDGSGKTEQFKLLVKRLKKNGIKVETTDFPQYEKESSFFIREYLDGKYGGWKEVGPYRASVFYAMDRFDIGPQIKQWLAKGKWVVSNRYVASNMGHQGGKILNRNKRLKYFKWLDEIEYKILGIPKPTKTIILHVPSKISMQLIKRRGVHEYEHGIKRDIHQQDLRHLKQAEAAYLDMAKTFKNDFHLIECAPEGKLLTIPEIHEKIWSYIQKMIK